MSHNLERGKGDGAREGFEHEPGAAYSLETVAELTGLSRRSILVYTKSGLVRAEERSEGDYVFDEEAVYTIRKIEILREAHGVNLAGIRMILDLMDELRALEREMRFFRG